MTPEEDKLMEMLILTGAMEIAGLDEQGNPLYVFTNKMKEVMPEIYEEHLKDINQKIMNLWDKGFVEVKFDDDGDFKVSITDDALDEEKLATLSKEDRWSVEEMKRITRIDK